MSYGQTPSTVWGPKQLTNGDDDGVANCIEVSLHTLPRPLQREFNHVFDDRNLSLNGMDHGAAEFFAIATNQPAREDLVDMGERVELEKDRLLNVFMTFAESVCQTICRAGYWADYIDPCSGLPMLTRNCNKVYSEVDGMECCLGYKSYNAGFCKILMHPKWGSAVYPATMFCFAPQQLVINILSTYQHKRVNSTE